MKKTTCLLTAFNQASFNQFVRLSSEQKSDLLKKSGLLVDSLNDHNEHVDLYFIDGYFAEEIRYSESGAHIVLPYKNGYITEKFVEVREILVPRTDC